MPKRKRKLTPWTRYVKANLSARIKTMGSATEAMKELGREWRAMNT